MVRWLSLPQITSSLVHYSHYCCGNGRMPSSCWWPLRETRWVAGKSKQQGRQRIRAQTIHGCFHVHFLIGGESSVGLSLEPTYDPQPQVQPLPVLSAPWRSTWHLALQRTRVRTTSSTVSWTLIKLKPSHHKGAWGLAILLGSSLG